MKKVIILSLGGSLIIPEEIDVNFLKEFKKVILKNSKEYKFIIVCGGGSIARKYIHALGKLGMSEKFQDLSGISATRMNARFMSHAFKIDLEKGIPHTMDNVKKYFKKQNVVFCGALDYKINQTSDSDAVKIAAEFKSDFINLTNVQGLYDKNPAKFKDAKFIPEISFMDFYKMATKKKFKPGQHFVLDQTAAKNIMDKKITTYIIGKDLKNLDNLLNEKKFKGTVIRG